MKAFAAPRTICQSCRQTSTRQAAAPWTSPSRLFQQSRPVSSTSTRTGAHSKSTRSTAALNRQSRRWLASSAVPIEDTSTTPTDLPPSDISQQDLADYNARVHKLAKTILDHPGVPTEDHLVNVLTDYNLMAQRLVNTKHGQQKRTTTPPEKTATSALLSNLDAPSKPSVTRLRLIESLTAKAFDMLLYGPVFITPRILQLYIDLQCLLKRPESFPAVFTLYREKPVPRPSSEAGLIAYDNPNPDKPATAVQPAVADMAIDAAIASRDLALALATIEATYCTTAYKRSKFLRSALFPLTGFLCAPPAAYTLATRFSDYQNTMDPAMATNIAMAAMMTYTVCVGSIGYVALTTANDQMVRVTWAPGVPLWERWVREEERAALDKLSQAWGFASTEKWGEEEGEEWDFLKEFCGLRGLMLDRVELMDGME
ncbi:unnamed protein product [Aureobasidium uvarum]|uniref:Uncharacterized protein n=1 Tax=Aureobasidium uvarum TaxID=2773716 RepID=A0A9N8KCT6_9PEZI|nr:unnamed protein product [Aureobasidium uvarum]